MNALVSLDSLKPEVVFAPGGVDALILKLEADIRAMALPDASTEAGRDELKSLAYKIARSKTGLDEMGKTFVADLKKQSGVVDAQRKIMRDRLDALKDAVRKPVTDWENDEEVRLNGHKAALQALRDASVLGLDPTSQLIEERLRSLGQIAQRDWQEFATEANGALAVSEDTLRAALASAKKREAEAAELNELRAKAAAQAQRDRDEQIAREAAEKARLAAEAAAQAERDRIERDKQAAVERAEQADRDRIAAEERAEQNRQAAIEEERARQQAEVQRLADEAAAREADSKHKRAVNQAAVAALVEGGMSEKTAKTAIALIAKKKVPAVAITY